MNSALPSTARETELELMRTARDLLRELAIHDRNGYGRWTHGMHSRVTTIARELSEVTADWVTVDG